MELISNGRFINNLKRQWRRRKYRRIDDSRKNMKVVRFGAGKSKRSRPVWNLRKLRFKFSSPLKLWKKFKNAYMNMMLRLSSNVSGLNTGGTIAGNVVGFGTNKRIPKARHVPLAYNKTDFENRLVYEIYKSLVVSMELNSR